MALARQCRKLWLSIRPAFITVKGRLRPFSAIVKSVFRSIGPKYDLSEDYNEGRLFFLRKSSIITGTRVAHFPQAQDCCVNPARRRFRLGCAHASSELFEMMDVTRPLLSVRTT